MVKKAPKPVTQAELKRLERNSPEGLALPQIIEYLAACGITISEDTFRNWVKRGLLPCSVKRRGRKGLHQGTYGLYPVAVIGRIVMIKQFMKRGLMLSEIAEAHDLLMDPRTLEKLEHRTRAFVAQVGKRPRASAEARALAPHVDALFAKLRYLSRLAAQLAA